MAKTVDKKIKTICPECQKEVEFDLHFHVLQTETQLKLSKNGIITLNRGDTFTLPVYINIGSGVYPETYALQKHLKEGCPDDGKEEHYYTDHLYFALLEPGQKWEDAILKKAYWAGSKEADTITKTVLIHFYSEDTEYLKPGNYYYQIKLQRCKESTNDGFEHVDTIVQRTKFVILE